MLDPGEVIVIDDSDEETMMRPPKAKRHRRGSSPLHLHQFGRQSQPININDFDSEVGLEELREAIDVGLHYVQEAGVAAGVDAVAQEEVEAPVMVTNATIITADEAAQALPQLINILPHLDPEYGLKLLREKILCEGQSHTIEHCLQSAVDQLLANVTYPKVQRFLKRKRLDTDSDDEDGEQVSGPQSTRFRNAAMNDLAASDPTCRIFQSGKSAYKTKTFLADERKGKAYIEKALIDLDNLFPLMKTEHIRCIFSVNHNKKFVPTYIALKAETLLPNDERPYVPLQKERARKPTYVQKHPSSKKGKGKAKAKQATEGDGAVAYDAEREWFIAYLLNKGDGTSYDHARILVPAAEEGDTECGCCFGDDDLMFMVQCAEGHNFCRDCIRKMTEVAVGAQTANVICPHTDGCEAKFHDRDLRKAMPVKLYNTYCGIIQRKELEAAGISGLESCPYCNFALIIENPQERLFVCQSDDCSKVSCRQCRKQEHLPKTCEETANDNVLNHRHAVEEAMSAALIRKCPKCDQACVKGDGCNKMRCHTCATMFCNVCRTTITGYEHFDQTPANYAQPKDPKKCRLWDPRDQDLYRDEVAAARENAQREILENEKGNVQEDDVEVALPEVNIVPRRPPMPHFGPAEPGRPRMNDPRAGARANALLPVDGDRVGILEERFRAVARIPLPLAPNERNERMRGYLQEMEGRIARLHEARLPPVAAKGAPNPQRGVAKAPNSLGRAVVEQNAPRHIEQHSENRVVGSRADAPLQRHARARRLNDERQPRAAADVHLDLPVEPAAPVNVPALPAKAFPPAPVARLDAAPALRNRAVRGQIQPPVLNVPEMPPGVPRLDDVDFRLQRLIHELRARRDQGGDNQDDFATLARAEQQLRRALMGTCAANRGLSWAVLAGSVRRQAGAVPTPEVMDHELVPPRRISPRQPGGHPIDPLSVLLVLHQQYPDWADSYYDSLVFGRPAFFAHLSFNQYATLVVEGLKDGKIQPPVEPAAGRVSCADVLRQLHPCWSVGATNLVTLLERIMQNAGVAFPGSNRRLPRDAGRYEVLMINNCPERILLSHIRSLSRSSLLSRFRRAAEGPARVNQQAIGADNERVNQPPRGQQPGAGIPWPPAVQIPDDPPPAYGAIIGGGGGGGGGAAGIGIDRLPA